MISQLGRFTSHPEADLKPRRHSQQPLRARLERNHKQFASPSISETEGIEKRDGVPVSLVSGAFRYGNRVHRLQNTHFRLNNEQLAVWRLFFSVFPLNTVFES